MAKQFGIDVYLGNAEFTGKDTIRVNGKDLKFAKACVATGARPFVPPIPGLDSVPYFTSESIFNLTEKPESLLIVGSGPIGSELGQAFARLGINVTMIEKGNHFLPREDPDAASILHEKMREDGVNILFGTTPTKFSLQKTTDAHKWSPKT